MRRYRIYSTYSVHILYTGVTTTPQSCFVSKLSARALTMAVIYRQPKQSSLKLATFIAPLFYLSSGVLIGFAACFAWLQQTSQTPLVQQAQVVALPWPSLDSSPVEDRPQNFFAVAEPTGTDKVAGLGRLDACLKDDSECTRPRA